MMSSSTWARRWVAPFMAIVTMLGLVLFLQSLSLLSYYQIIAAPLQELTPQDSCSSELFFSEYVEGSSNNKALEIYNGTGTAITLTDHYSVGLFTNGSATLGNRDPLLGTLADGDVYVIANANAAQAILDEADLTSGVTFFNGNDAVVLFKDGQIIDVIGQIGFDPGTEWGSGDVSTLNHTIVRKDSVTIGDSDGSDAFEPSLEWEGYAQDTFSFLGSHTQNCSGTGEAELTISKDAPATAMGGERITYTIAVDNIGAAEALDVTITDTLPADVSFVTYTSSSPLIFTYNAPNLVWEAGTVTTDTGLYISLTVDLPASFTATITNTVVVTTTTAGDAPENNSAQAITTLPIGGACHDSFIAIYDIQGDGANSPLPGGITVTTQGVVVGDFQNSDQLNGFFLQDASGDGNAATSDGIFVYAPGSADVAVGDVIRLSAEVSEYFGLTELSNVSELLNCGIGSATPATLKLPVEDLTDFEPYEGMLINIPQELHVTELFQLGRFGQVTLSQGERLFQPTNVITPGLDANLLQEANDKRSIILDDGSSQQNPDPIIYPSPELSATNTLRGGDMLPSLTGILNYRVGEYRVEPLEVITFTHANERPSMPQDVGGSLKVASFNVLNYFSTIDEGKPICGAAENQDCRGADSASEFTRQRAKIINAITNMDADIVGLMELENNSTAAIQDLVDGLNAIAAAYDYIDTGIIGTDAIKVAIIYKPATVTPVGDFAILDSSIDPYFDDQKNRPALVQTFDQNSNGERLTIVVNHLKSKGSDCDDVGDPDLGDGQGNCNVTRTNAAIAEANWLATDPTGSEDPDFLIIGDLNAYAMEDPITAFKEAGYSNLIQAFLGLDAYSYVFDGQWGYLDHALSNESLTPQVTGVSEWHINADEPTALDYNEEFKSAEQLISLYSEQQYRASDHDPVIVGLNLYDDEDADGVINEIEEGVPNPDGKGNGDGNGDGISDSQQANVTSLPNATEEEEYVTLESSAGTSLIDVQASPAAPTLPKSVLAFPQGLFNFIVDGVAMSETVMVTLTVHADNVQINNYWKQDANDDWYKFDYDKTTGAVIGNDSYNKTIITLHLMDGTRGDNDEINGQITEKGAPALTNIPVVITLSGLDKTAIISQQLTGLALLLLMTTVGLWLYGKRNRNYE